MFSRTIAASIAAATLTAGGMASAATMAACAPGSGLACVVNAGEFGTNASGNDKEDSVESALAAALNLLSIDLTLLGKYEADGMAGYGTAGSGQSGTWTAPDAVSYFTVKAANSFIIYEAFGLKTGSWSTFGILTSENGNGNGKDKGKDKGAAKQGGNQPDLSHISFWNAPGTPDEPDEQDPNPVPLPAGGVLLLGALGLLGLRRRLFG